MSGVLLHLLRHGAPETPGRLIGRTDCAPTPEGIAACEHRVRDLTFDRLFSSDLARTRQATETIAATRQRPFNIDARWRELDFGAWDGCAAADIDAAAIGRFWEDPDACPPPGGERWSAMKARIAAAIDDLPPCDTLVVTHGGAMRAALSVLCGFEQRALWAFDLPYAALLSLRIFTGERRSAQIAGLRT